MENTLVWFKNNLRSYNNSSLVNACKEEGKTIGVYVFDPKMFEETKWGFKKTEKYRAQFLIETVTELKEELAKKNITLLVYFGNTTNVIEAVCKKHNIKNLYTQKEWTSEEKEEVQNLKKQINVTWHFEYDQFLVHPNDIPFESIEKTPKVFTAFRKKIEAKLQIRPNVFTKTQETDNLVEDDGYIPNLDDLSFEPFNTHPNSAFPFKGGEKSGLERIENYFFRTKNVSKYKQTRNGLIGEEYSSKISAWLANGSLCPRFTYWKLKEYETKVEKNEDTYWLFFELLWRDYFKYISLKHQDKIFYQSGILDKKYEWKSDKKALEVWTEGKTEEPFVNANMLELKETGFMSNRGRQNVASFWAKEWQQDWRVAAAYFEALLIDYDVHSNYGNWMYNSGVGNDPRDRKFNIKRQADMYDPNQDYMKLWLNQ